MRQVPSYVCKPVNRHVWNECQFYVIIHPYSCQPKQENGARNDAEQLDSFAVSWLGRCKNITVFAICGDEAHGIVLHCLYTYFKHDKT